MSMVIMMCNPESVKKVPHNYISLSIFTLFMSYILSISTIRFDTEILLIGLGTTTGITSALTLYASQTRYDFTECGGYLLVALMGIIITSMINIFIVNSVLQSIIAGTGAIIFSGFIVHDTQMIIGGKHRKYSYSIDDYVFAALSIYLDIINLFLFILDLLTNRI
jgi:protein lifeguard